jgi:hypothetical protein
LPLIFVSKVLYRFSFRVIIWIADTLPRTPSIACSVKLNNIIHALNVFLAWSFLSGCSGFIKIVNIGGILIGNIAIRGFSKSFAPDYILRHENAMPRQSQWQDVINVLDNRLLQQS